jgi:hypothetical protein
MNLVTTTSIYLGTVGRKESGADNSAYIVRVRLGTSDAFEALCANSDSMATFGTVDVP